MKDTDIKKITDSLKPHIDDIVFRVNQSAKKENSGLIQSINETVIRLDERMKKNEKDHKDIKDMLITHDIRITTNTNRINWVYAWSAGVVFIVSFVFYLQDKF